MTIIKLTAMERALAELSAFKPWCDLVTKDLQNIGTACRNMELSGIPAAEVAVFYRKQMQPIDALMDKMRKDAAELALAEKITSANRIERSEQ